MEWNSVKILGKMSGNADPYLIESAAKVLDVLDLFRRTGEPLTLGDVRRNCASQKAPYSGLYTLEEGLPAPHSGHLFLRHEKPPIGMATASPWITFAAEITRGLRSAASRCGVDVLIATNEMDGMRTLANVDELLAAKVDVLVEINQDAKLGGAISERCRKAGIPLIAMAFPLPGATNFGVDVVKAGLDGGRELSSEVMARWRGEIDLVLLVNVPDAGYIQRARLMGMLQGLGETISVPADRIHALNARRDSDEGRQAIVSLLSRSRAKRIVVLATNDTQALAAVAAVENFDRDRDVMILSHGGVTPARQELCRKGSSLWGTIAHFPESFGDRVVPAALQILAGQKVPSNNILRHAVLTQKNVSQHYPAGRWRIEPICYDRAFVDPIEDRSCRGRSDAVHRKRPAIDLRKRRASPDGQGERALEKRIFGEGHYLRPGMFQAYESASR